MLRFAEEIMLLLLDDDGGGFARVSDRAVGYALAGGVLMDLALADRIDTDLHRLMAVDAKSTGDDLLDPTLAEIAASETNRNARFWVEHVAKQAPRIRDAALARLVERGILERRSATFLWVFRSRRYPVLDGTAEREVKLRILDVLLGDDLPAPRDIVIICLADACGIFHELLDASQLERARPRFEQVRKMDLIGQAVSQAVADLDHEAQARMEYLIEQSAPSRG